MKETEREAIDKRIAELKIQLRDAKFLTERSRRLRVKADRTVSLLGFSGHGAIASIASLFSWAIWPQYVAGGFVLSMFALTVTAFVVSALMWKSVESGLVMLEEAERIFREKYK